MKQKIFTLFLVLFGMLGIGSSVYAATITSAVGAVNWSTMNGGVAPAYNDDVIVPSGSTVTIDLATSTCTNLTVQDGGIVIMNNTFYVCNINVNSGGKFYSSSTVSANKTFYWGVLYVASAYTAQTGDFHITVDGTGQFGGTVAGTNDGIAIFFGEYATSLTMDGTSTSTKYIGRLMANNAIDQLTSTDFNLNIKQNLYISMSGASLGFSLQNNKKFVGSRTLTIFPNYTVTTNANARFHANNSTPSADEGNFIYNIYGTLDVSLTYFDLWSTSFAGSTHLITVNLGNGTDPAVLKLGRDIRLKKYFTGQSITMNWNNPNSKVVFAGNGGITISCNIYSGGAYIDDISVFPSSIYNLSYENTSTSAGLVIPKKVTVTKLDSYGYGNKLYVGAVVDGNAKAVTMGKLFNLSGNNAYIVTGVSASVTTVINTQLAAAGTWVKGATLTDANGNSYYCDSTGMTIGTLRFVQPASGASTTAEEISGGDILVTGNATNELLSTYTARFSSIPYIEGNLTNGAGAIYFAKNSFVKGSFTNNGTNTLTGDLTVGNLINNGTLPLAAKMLTIKGSLSGTGTVNASSGYLAFEGTTEQTLAASNLSGAINELRVRPGAKLTTSGDFSTTYLTIQSNSTYGPGTLINGGNVTSTNAYVQQYLTGSGGTTPNTRFWYFASPLTDATSNAIDVITANPANKLWSFSETTYGSNLTTGYAPINDNTTALAQGMGYVARLGDNKTVQFAGTTLNNGNINITATRSGTELAKRGYNLIGNPYPSYLDINAAFNNVNTTGLESTIWYRSFNSTSNMMAFDTYNAASGTGISLGSNAPALTNYIPPMQAFWVRASTDGVNGNLALTNSMRSHQVGGNKLRSTTADTVCFEKIRLQITNGKGFDQAFIGMYPQARDSFERYDSHKMFNDNDSIPEIYTFAGKEEVAINGLAPFAGRKEMKLGFKTRKSGRFTIKALELSNLDADTKVILKDNLMNVSQDLTETPEYTFTSDAAATTERFTLTIVKTATILAKSEVFNIDVRALKNGRVEILLESNNKATVCVFDLEGKMVHVQDVQSQTCILNKPLNKGAYLVKVSVDGHVFSKKVLVTQ
jgi:hypothetical protein